MTQGRSEDATRTLILAPLGRDATVARDVLREARLHADICRDGAEFSVTFRSDDPPGAVRQRLRELPPPPDEVVLVSWDAQTAVITDWDAFVTHWDDFCYPSSDDVTVLPLAGDWDLCYRHYEVMQFRPRRTPNAPDVGATSLQP